MGETHERIISAGDSEPPEEHYYYQVIKHLKDAGARLLVADHWREDRKIKNASVFEEAASADNMGFYYTHKWVLKFFYDDLKYCSPEYIDAVFRGFTSVENNGFYCQPDMKSQYVNIVNHRRVTTDTPSVYDNTIYFFGQCTAFGYATEDILTVESILQRLLNDRPVSSTKYRVQNLAAWTSLIWSQMEKCSIIPEYRKIISTQFKEGDLAIILSSRTEQFRKYHDEDNEVVRYYNIYDSFDRPHEFGAIFFDGFHMNHRGYTLLARRIHGILANEANTWLHWGKRRERGLPSHVESGSDAEVAADTFRELEVFISELKKEAVAITGTVGGIVMNCNPFTLGHRYLIEKASISCDFIYVFVVEEDKSEIPFKERFEMVREGILDLPNVKVLPSGTFMISALTLPEYFGKETQPDIIINPAHDLEIFAKHIAPALNITKRFAGEEPLCNITNQYNQAMAEILPQYGIDFIVCKRKEELREPISASRVRALLKDGRLEELAKLVPVSTYLYLLKRVPVGSLEHKYLRLKELNNRLENLTNDQKAVNENLQKELTKARAINTGIKNSWSWKITSPLRRVRKLIKYFGK